MIFYFSATGNSLYAAKTIAQNLGEDIINIATIMNDSDADCTFNLKNDEVIGFIFPLFAWSAPQMVFEFIEQVKFTNYNNNYTFTIATFGQNIGRFDNFIKEALNDKNMNLNSAFSLNMPNNYIMVWDEAKQIDCLKKAEERIGNICEILNERKDIFDIETIINGSKASKGTGAEAAANMNEWFNNRLHDPSQFYVTDDCVGCKLCIEVCNGQTLTYPDKKPVWGDNCYKCLACLHACPNRAIQFGKFTESNGRYKNPNIDIDELKIFK